MSEGRGGYTTAAPYFVDDDKARGLCLWVVPGFAVTFAEQKQYRVGVTYVALSALAWSSSGLFVRLIHAT
jgi:hypothetical protein